VRVDRYIGGRDSSSRPRLAQSLKTQQRDVDVEVDIVLGTSTRTVGTIDERGIPTGVSAPVSLERR
jgi:hypothetical protein